MTKDAAAALIRWSGIEALLRRTRGRKKVGVLVYHDPTVERFEEHMQFLSSRYTLISLGQLAAALRRGDWSQVPPRAVVITFDDGHRRNRDLRASFERYGVRPSIYLSSSVVDGDGLLSFQIRGIDPEPLKLMTTSERRAVTDAALATHPGELGRHALTPDDVATLSDIVDFGSHTLSHPVLPLCSDSEADAEITRSRAEVERLSGVACRHFSYPNGDYTEREIDLVRKAGYASARTTEVGWNGPGTDPLRLRMISLADNASVNMLATHLTGLLRLRRLLPGLRHQRRLNTRAASLRRDGATRT